MSHLYLVPELVYSAPLTPEDMTSRRQTLLVVMVMARWVVRWQLVTLKRSIWSHAPADVLRYAYVLSTRDVIFISGELRTSWTRRLSSTVKLTDNPEAFLAAAVWGGQRGGHICIFFFWGGGTIPDDIMHARVSEWCNLRPAMRYHAVNTAIM